MVIKINLRPKKRKMNITVIITMKTRIEITLKLIKLRLSDDCFLIETPVAICSYIRNNFNN